MTSRDPGIQSDLQLAQAASLAPRPQERSHVERSACRRHRAATLIAESRPVDYLRVIAGALSMPGRQSWSRAGSRASRLPRQLLVSRSITLAWFKSRLILPTTSRKAASGAAAFHVGEEPPFRTEAAAEGEPRGSA